MSCTRLDDHELSARYKGFQEKKKDLTNNVEGIAVERGKLTKVVVDLEVRLKELESRLKESELRATKEMEAIKELEEELTMYKKEVVE